MYPSTEKKLSCPLEGCFGAFRVALTLHFNFRLLRATLKSTDADDHIGISAEWRQASRLTAPLPLTLVNSSDFRQFKEHSLSIVGPAPSTPQ